MSSGIYQSGSLLQRLQAAVNVFTIHLAAELKDTNIKVNSVHPGWVKTVLGSDAAPMFVLDGAKTTVAVALLGSDSPNGPSSMRSIKNCPGKTSRFTQAEDTGRRRQCPSPTSPTEEGYTIECFQPDRLIPSPHVNRSLLFLCCKSTLDAFVMSGFMELAQVAGLHSGSRSAT
jgi:NAD(P)-dependent dehydrogenase (short-subunit alcohol dehydrogenase family)